MYVCIYIYIYTQLYVYAYTHVYFTHVFFLDELMLWSRFVWSSARMRWRVLTGIEPSSWVSSIYLGLNLFWWGWLRIGGFGVCLAFGNNIIVHVLCCKHTNTSSMSSQMASLLTAIAEHAEHAVYEPCMVHIGCYFPMLILTDRYGWKSINPKSYML